MLKINKKKIKVGNKKVKLREMAKLVLGLSRQFFMLNIEQYDFMIHEHAISLDNQFPFSRSS
jgi:hypothetical protein